MSVLCVRASAGQILLDGNDVDVKPHIFGVRYHAYFSGEHNFRDHDFFELSYHYPAVPSFRARN